MKEKFKNRNIEGEEENAMKPSESSREKNAFLLTVDYDLSIKKAMEAGCYDLIRDEIMDKNFPSTETGTNEIKIELVELSFDDISTEVALRQLEYRRYRPATLRELLAFGARYPEVQRRFPIIALGSFNYRRKDGHHCCPSLDYDSLGKQRQLCFPRADAYWGVFCRFAAIR